MFPKVIAFETSGVLFSGDLRADVWGKGPGASKKLADNVQRVDDRVLRDGSNHKITVELYQDVPRIIHDLLKNGASLAIVSRHDDKSLCDRVLHYFQAIDPKTKQNKGIIHLVKYDEIVDESKEKHFKRIHNWEKCEDKDIVYFEKALDPDLVQQGVSVTVPGQGGITWEQYHDSIAIWRGETPVPPQKLKELKIAHFNDVYKVSDQSPPSDPDGKKINVSKFATMLSDVRKAWKKSGHGDGLIIFSGDIFSPSPHSSITRGKHMASVANALKVDIGVIGNHEFDFGVRRLFELIKETKFPWLLSNVIDTTTGIVPEPLKDIHVLESSGVRIGLIGLVEEEWLATITGWPKNFQWQSMTKIGLKLSEVLRDPSGPHKCDIVIALTHSRVPNDITLARELFALSPQAQASTDITKEHGVDLLLGGHDHFYWISKGVSSWDGYNLQEELLDAKDDRGDVLVVKSGTDFQDLSELTIGLKATAPGSVRRMVIGNIEGIRHLTRGDMGDDEDMQQVIKSEIASISASLPIPICTTEVELPRVSRTGESVLANWIADCLKPVYNDVLSGKTVDGVIVCTGDIREGGYPVGPITLENLMEIVPYTDPMVVLEMDGKSLWTAMESGLSMWPKTEGRFPAISGFKVTWNSSDKPNSRVKEILMLGGPDDKPTPIQLDHKYNIAVGGYMAEGGDGYDILKEQKVVLGEENGQPKSTLIRKFLLGAHYVNKVSHDPEAKPQDLQPETFSFVAKARMVLNLPALDPASMRRVPAAPNSPHFQQITSALPDGGQFIRRGDPTAVPQLDSELAEFIQESIAAFKWPSAPKVIKFAMKVAESEDMGLVDSYDRQRRGITIEGEVSFVLTRGEKSGENIGTIGEKRGEMEKKEVRVEKDLPKISPVIDGRLKDIGSV